MGSKLKNKTPQDSNSKKYNTTFRYVYDITDEELNELDNSTNFIIKEKNYTDELSDIFSTIDEKDKFKDNIEKSESLDEAKERLKIDKQTVDLFCESIKTDIKLKKWFSKILLFLLFIQLIAVNVIFVLKGLNIINYSESIFNIYISGSLIEVVALVTIIVKYLFNDNISESLNNILEKNKEKK